MNRIKSILLILAVMFMPLNLLAAEGNGEEKGIDIPEIVLHHLSDAYEWHIAGDVSIPLPIIVRSSATGEWTFCTEKSLPGNFFFDETHHGKIYEKMPDGTTKRPLDLSLTKSVCQIWIVAIILIAVFLSVSRWYKKHDSTSEAPKGFVGAMEMLVMYIHDDVIKACVGEKHYKKYGCMFHNGVRIREL
jgi:F-type H+-transporting ATPase subunit a